MTVQSFTGCIDTEGSFADIATLASVTFTATKSYKIFVGGQAEIKLANAIFPVSNERFDWVADSTEIKIKNGSVPCTLVVYGAE